MPINIWRASASAYAKHFDVYMFNQNRKLFERTFFVSSQKRKIFIDQFCKMCFEKTFIYIVELFWQFVLISFWALASVNAITNKTKRPTIKNINIFHNKHICTHYLFANGPIPGQLYRDRSTVAAVAECGCLILMPFYDVFCIYT